MPRMKGRERNASLHIILLILFVIEAFKQLAKQFHVRPQKKQVQSITHTIHGGDDMQEFVIVNYVEIGGEVLRMSELSKEKAAKVSQILQERFMDLAGYKRQSA